MLDEIIPALEPLKRSKMLTAEPTITRSLPMIDSKISFRPFYEYLKNKRTEVSRTKEKIYLDLINEFEATPSLLKPVTDLGELYEHADLMEMLTTSLFPVIGRQENNFALAAPYQFSVFYYTENFRKLFFDSGEQHLLLPDGMPTDELKAIQCSMIYDHVLEQFYGMKLNESPELIYTITDAKSGMLRYYNIR